MRGIEISQSDVERVSDLWKPGMDLDLLVQQYPYHLRAELRERVIEELRRRGLRQEFCDLTPEEKEQLFIEDKMGEKFGYDVERVYEQCLENWGETKVLKAREKRRKEKAAAEAKKLAAQKERERKRWASVFWTAITCWSLMMAFCAYLLKLAWYPEWGHLADRNVFLYVFKALFSLIPLVVMVEWCIFLWAHASKRLFIREFFYTIPALYLTYEVLFHIIHTSWGCFFFLIVALLVWFIILCHQIRVDELGETHHYVLIRPLIFAWCAIYVFAICGMERVWGPERELWKNVTKVERHGR